MASSSDSGSSCSGGSTESTKSTLSVIEEALADLEEEEARTVESKFDTELKEHYKSDKEFQHLPPNQRKVAVAYSMITAGKKSDFTSISPDLLLFLVTSNVPDVYPDKEDILSATFAVPQDPSCNGVYLLGSEQYLSFVLMKSWFSQKVQHPADDLNIVAVTELSSLTLGDVVIAPIPASHAGQEQEDRQYHRATVRKLLNERNQVEVQFCDLGSVEVVNMNSLLKYDHPLMSLEELPPLSIFARLEGVDMSIYSRDHKPFLNKALTKMFRRASRNSVKCQVVLCLPHEPVRVRIAFQDPQVGKQTFENFWQQYIKWNIPKKRDSVVKAIMKSVCTTIKPGELNLKQVCRHAVKLVYVDLDSDAIYVLNDPSGFVQNKMTQMQEFYNSQQKCLNSASSRTIIRMDCAYAWLNPEDECWYRGVIIEQFIGDQVARVVLWLVDVARIVTVSVEELRNLDKNFCFASCVIRIKLAHVKVLNTVEVQQYLEQNYAVGTELAALPLKKVNLDQDPGDLKVRFIKSAYEMILAECGKCSDGFGITVQTRLWLASLVEAEGPAASTFRRNFAEVRQDLIKRLRTSCPPKNTEDEIDTVELPPQIARCLSHVNISYEGSGPHDFYVQSFHQLKKLRIIEIYLGTEEMDGSLKRFNEDTNLAVGDLAVFLTVKNDCHGSQRILLRVLIIEANDKTFTVLAIDYGELYQNIERKYLRLIPEKVRKIPPMCQRVHLELPTGYIPAELDGFSYTACVAWLKYIKVWLDLGGTYWAWNLRRDASPVFLTELQQKLAFDRKSREWIPGHAVKYDAHQQVNRLWETSEYSNPYLAPFFSSIGVSLSYHEFFDYGNDQQSMEFPNIVSFLINRKFVVKC